mmetsp:Transcript_101323/g.321804  ORF Transcript_101323/g.321804 Transcript_101323/m.321804 type:complete len:362 (-) Transcript_101323:358-1443(-)
MPQRLPCSPPKLPAAECRPLPAPPGKAFSSRASLHRQGSGACGPAKHSGRLLLQGRLLLHGSLRPWPLRLGRILSLSRGLLHLLVDLARLLHVQLCPHRHAVKLQVPHKVSRAAILDLVQEEGLPVRVPVRILVMDRAVRAANVRADQRHWHGVPVGRRELRQHLQRLPPDALGVLQELFRDVVSRDDALLAVLRGHGSLVGYGIEELSVEPEDPGLPVAGEALDRLLHDVLGAVRVVLEVIAEDLGIILALLHGQLPEAQREGHHGLLHHEGLPPAGLDLLQQPCRRPLAFEGENGGSHGHARVDAGLHVLGLVVDEVLDLPARHDVATALEDPRHLIIPLRPLEDRVDDVVANDKIDEV